MLLRGSKSIPLGQPQVNYYPGSQMAMVVVSRGRHGPFPLLLQDVALLRDDDGDGRVEWRSHLRDAERASWIGVSLAEGAHDVATVAPRGLGAGQPFEPEVVIEGEGRDALVRIAGPRYQVLMVRPGDSGGAWSGLVIDGGGGDADGAHDAWTSVAPHSLHALDAGGLNAPPSSFSDGDVLVVMDIRTLGWSVIELGGAVRREER